MEEKEKRGGLVGKGKKISPNVKVCRINIEIGLLYKDTFWNYLDKMIMLSKMLSQLPRHCLLA